MRLRPMVVAAAVLLAGTGCGAAPGSESSVRVFAGDGATTAGFSTMSTGQYASLDGPYVCSRTDDEVRLTGVLLGGDASGMEVTDVGVVERSVGVPSAEIARLRTLPQARGFSPSGILTANCDDDESNAVWIEVRLTGTRGSSSSIRYEFEVDGRRQVSDDIGSGFVLTP